MTLGQPFTRELLIIVERLELIPLVIAAVEIGSLGSLEDAFDTHPIWRVGENQINAVIRKFPHFLNAISAGDDILLHTATLQTSGIFSIIAESIRF